MAFTLDDLLKTQSVADIADSLYARRGWLMTQGPDPFDDDHDRAKSEILAQAKRIWEKRQSGDLTVDTVPFSDKSNKMFVELA